MDISVTTNPLSGLASAEQRLQAALVDVNFLQAEFDRTYQALERIERERPKQPGCSPAELADVRFQLSEVVAIGSERRAIQRDTATLVAQIDALRDQHFEMQQQMAAMRRQWFAGKATDGTADTEEQFGELHLRLATLRQDWVARDITSAVAHPQSPEFQLDEPELISAALREAVAV